MPDAPDPLAEASPQSLDELFSRDPLDYSSRDLDTIIGELRRYRALWARDEASGKTRATKTTSPKVSKPNVSLKDLGF